MKIERTFGMPLLFVIQAVIFLWATLSFAQSSTHYTIEFDVISGGGGESNSPNYSLFSTLGQSSAVGTSTSGSYTNDAGFWSAFLPGISAIPNPYDFGRVLITQSSPPKSFEVSNHGTGNLVLGTFSVVGGADFKIQDDLCSSKVLFPEGSCTFETLFAPTSLGKQTATVSIPSNDEESPLSVGLSGRGVNLMVDPEEGTVGSLITVGGIGFGTKKGKVLVGKASLKVQGWGDGSIQGTLTKAMTSGPYDVIVQGKQKGALPIKEPGGFAVRVPEITTKNPGGAVNKEVTLDGKFFGTAKGKVLFEVGGKLVSGKVTSWYMEPASGASTLRFVVPGKNVSRGTYTLRVTNKVGTGTVSFTVTP